MVVEIILGLLVLTEGYVIWNLFRKTELLETWVEDFTQRIETVQNNLKNIVNQLDNLKGEEVNAS